MVERMPDTPEGPPPPQPPRGRLSEIGSRLFRAGRAVWEATRKPETGPTYQPTPAPTPEPSPAPENGRFNIQDYLLLAATQFTQKHLAVIRNNALQNPTINSEYYTALSRNDEEGRKIVDNYQNVWEQEATRLAVQEAHQELIKTAEQGMFENDEPLAEKDEYIRSGEGTEWVTLSNVYGRRRVEVPASDEGKTAWMRKRLNRVESTQSPDGGELYKEELQTTALLLNALGKNKQHETLATKLSKEFSSRLTLHAINLQFAKAENIGAVQNLLGNVTDEQLKFFFIDSNDPTQYNLPVWAAFQAYEQHSAEYLQAKSRHEIEQVEDKIKTEIKNKLPANFQNRQPSSDVDATLISAQSIAQRLWDITARYEMADQLVQKDTKAQPTAEEVATGKVDMLGDYSNKGRFAFKRVISFDRWVYTQIENTRVQVKLLKDVNLKSSEYFDQVSSAMGDYYRDLLLNKYKTGNFQNENGQNMNNNPTLAFQQAEKDGKMIASWLVPKINAYRQIDPETGKESNEWVEKVDAKNIRWDGQPRDNADSQDPIYKRIQDLIVEGALLEDPKIDFSILGKNPMDFWMFRKVAQPDAARDALMGKPESFLRLPTIDSLQTIKDNFSYIGSSQFETKAYLAKNFILFSRKDQGNILDKPNTTLLEGDYLIQDLIRKGYFSKKDADLARKALWDSGLMPLLGSGQLAFSYFDILAFILGVSLEIFSKATSSK